MRNKWIPVALFSVWAGFLSACASVSDLSNTPPYDRYADETVVLKSPMPVEYDIKTQKPSKVVSAGTPVTIKRIILEKRRMRGPIIPSGGIDTQIFAVVEYPDPVTKSCVVWNYPLGAKQNTYGYAEQIIAAPWEPVSTAPLRYVGRDGKAFKD
jgi:hypothetical protein